MRLWLIRHGETEHNLNGIFQGQLDTRLTPHGIEQARRTARALEGVTFDGIYSSDLQRAHQTADAIAVGRDLEVRADPRLREVHYGVLQGVAYSEFRDVLREHGIDDWGPGVFSVSGVAPPQGESLDDLIRRVHEFFSEVLDDIDGAADIAIVTHGGTIRTIMTELLGMEAVDRGRLALANCGVTCFSRFGAGWVDEDHWTLEFHNRVFWSEGLSPTRPTSV